MTPIPLKYLTPTLGGSFVCDVRPESEAGRHE